jgi:hypothetical protein
MTSLNDITQKITSLAQLNLTRGYTKAYKTGKLYDNVGSYNTPSRVLGDIAISGGYVYHSFNVGTQPAFAPGVNTDYTLYYTGE